MKYLFEYHRHYLNDQCYEEYTIEHQYIEADTIELAKDLFLDQNINRLDYNKIRHISDISIISYIDHIDKNMIKSFLMKKCEKEQLENERRNKILESKKLEQEKKEYERLKAKFEK